MAILDDKGLQKVLDKIKNAANGCYEGIDLTVKFANEINATSSSESPYFGNGDCWQWIKKRIADGNFDGIMIGDFIPFEMINPNYSNNTYTYHARVAGINTHKGIYEGDSDWGYFYDPSTWDYIEEANNYYEKEWKNERTPNHIDFVCKEFWCTATWGIQRTYNGSNIWTNNAPVYDEYQKSMPYLNSFIYNILNNQTDSTVSNSNNMTRTCIWNYLPTALKNVIVYKYDSIESRHNDSETIEGITNDAYPYTKYPTDWYYGVNIGKIWIPSEFELTGTNVLGSPDAGNHASIMYPLFKNWYNRFLYTPTTQEQEPQNASWYWTSTPVSGSCNDAVGIDSDGSVGNYFVNSDCRVPVCFRIAAESEE